MEGDTLEDEVDGELELVPETNTTEQAAISAEKTSFCVSENNKRDNISAAPVVSCSWLASSFEKYSGRLVCHNGN